MSVAYRVHLRRHADIERRQLGGLIGGVTGAILPGLGLGNTKTNNPNHPTQPPSQGKGNNTPPAANPGTTPTPTVANGVSTPTGGGGSDSGGSNSGGSSNGGSNGGVSGGNNGGVSGGSSNGGGGSGGGGTTTSAGPATTAGSAASNRTSGTLNPSNTPSTSGTISNDGSSGTGSTPNSAGTVNVGGGSHGPVNEGLSDFTPGTRTSGDPSGSNPSTTGNTLGGGKTDTATGPIVAAIILSILFAIVVVVFILRRRSSKRRDELAIKWWFTRSPTSQSYYGDNEALNPGTSSRRSSFATTLDHSKSFLADTTIPPPPPMAEIGRPIGTDPALILDINADQNRFSIGSANSHNSQFLVVHHRESLQHETSASLMSCTESFPFPKPPLSSSADRTLFQACEGSPKKQESEMPYIASPTIARSTIQHTHGDPFADNNPFEDSAHLPGRIETVRRPFIPHLHDELEVNIGDSVRIVQIFDDGWAFVEKISQGEQGLVPVNCLLDLVQNPLLEGKRMSSQGAKIT